MHDTDQRRHAAFHEAAHAVIAINFGWWINDDGVYLEGDGFGFCGVRCYQDQHSTQAEVCYTLAGWVAETVLSPELAKPRSREDLQDSLDFMFCSDEEDDSDTETALRKLQADNPSTSDDEIIDLYLGYQETTLALLQQHEIWSAVTHLAEALLAKGRLNSDEVNDVVNKSTAR